MSPGWGWCREAGELSRASSLSGVQTQAMFEEKHIVLQDTHHNQRTGRHGDCGTWLACALLLEAVVSGQSARSVTFLPW